MRSLIHISFCGYLELESLIFVENFLFEPEYSESRAMILYLEDFYGDINFKDNITILYQYGLHTDFMLNRVDIKQIMSGSSDNEEDDLTHF